MVIFADVLTYHVVKGTVWSASLVNGEMAQTVEGKTITVDISSGIFILVNVSCMHIRTRNIL